MRFLILLTSLLAWSELARADVRAVVIGINDYEHQPRLEGAIADAEDIAAALKGIRASSVRLLKDREASRGNVFGALTELERQAKAGDTLIFSYAGHGGRERLAGGGKPTEMTESFLLSAFTPKGAASAERILDREINAWLRRVGERGARVIFVADSCHAGGMTRSIDARASITYRSVPDYGVPDVLLSSSDLEVNADLRASDIPHVTFFAATQADKRSPEVLIEGRKRGALSFAFARALEGAADRRGTGTLSRFELGGYITATVRQLSEAQQTPEVVYRSGSEHEPVLAGIPRRTAPGIEHGRVRLRIINTDEATRSGLANSLAGALVVDRSADADLVWDGKDETVVSGLGDPVAHGVSPARMQGVVDKWRILPEIKRIAINRPLTMSLRPNDARHPAGREVAFESGALPFPHVMVFNLAPDGMLQYLYPQPRRSDDARPLRIGEVYSLKLRVVAPFGADHLVVIASATPLDTLQKLLRGAPRTTEIPTLLREALAGADFAVGLQALYTTDTGGAP